MRNIIFISLLAVMLLQTACSWAPDLSYIGLPKVHKIDIQQGNVVEQVQINQLRSNMTKEQVTFIMGTPMLNDTFHANRWDYIFRFKPGYGEVEEKQATLYFNKAEKLINIKGTFRPGDEAEDTHNSTEIVTVPLEIYEDDVSSTQGYWKKFWSFFAWTDEHKGIPETGGDTPVNVRGEVKAKHMPGTIEIDPLK